MFREYGNIILFEGNDLESRIIKLFTKSKYTHTALQVHRNVAMSITRKGRITRYLDQSKDWIDSYLILEHKEIDLVKRRKIRRNNHHMTNDYDTGVLFRIGLRHLLGKEPDLEDISRHERFNCSSKPAYLYLLEDLSVMKGVNYSQVEPQMFLEGGNFRVVKEWKK